MGMFTGEMKIKPHIEVFKKSEAYDMAVKKLISNHIIEFQMILEGCKKITREY